MIPKQTPPKGTLSSNTPIYNLLHTTTSPTIHPPSSHNDHRWWHLHHISHFYRTKACHAAFLPCSTITVHIWPWPVSLNEQWKQYHYCNWQTWLRLLQSHFQFQFWWRIWPNVSLHWHDVWYLLQGHCLLQSTLQPADQLLQCMWDLTQHFRKRQDIAFFCKDCCILNNTTPDWDQYQGPKRIPFIVFHFRNGTKWIDWTVNRWDIT